MRHLFPFLAAGLLSVALLGCSGSASHSTRTGVGHLTILLTDAPGDFEQVNVVVTGVSIHSESGGWETLSDEAATYDLMQLRNGVFTTLASGDVPAGHYDQIRLHLGEGSTVVVDGETHPVVVPSGLQSGYKLVGGFDVPDGGGIELALDFDAARSVVRTGAKTYRLKPTVRVLVTELLGRIAGHLLPEGVEATVYAIQGADTLQSGEAGSDGRFTLAALAAGVYDVAIHPAETHADTTLTGVSVVPGETTDIGDVALTPVGTTAATRDRPPSAGTPTAPSIR